MSSDPIIAVSVPMAAIKEAASAAVARAFYYDPNQSRYDGVGTKHISVEVEKAIKALDFGPIIAAAINEHLTVTVAEIVRDAVRAEAKKQIKALRASHD